MFKDIVYDLTNSSKIDIINNMINTIGCINYNEKYTYISGPITFGKRMLDYVIQNNKTLDQLKKTEEYNKLIVENCNDLNNFADNISYIDTGLVINPARVNFTNFKQQDYLNFWEKVIITYIKKVYFIKNWWYSIGSTFEYYTALKNKLEIYDDCGKILTYNKARCLIKFAIEEKELAGISNTAQIALLKLIENLEV